MHPEMKIIICDKNGVYEFYFGSCINIIFNEQNKTYTPFLSHIIFIANLSAILIGTIL